jgi:toxin FitB
MAAGGLTADTSVVVPSVAEWHALHEKAAGAAERVRRLPGHVLAESFAVLTRLPGGLSLDPRQALEVLLDAFPEEPLPLPPPDLLGVLQRLASVDAGGGHTYDAIVGATAARARYSVLTADRRALPTYALVGAESYLIE